jgi:hypothetical protein
MNKWFRKALIPVSIVCSIAMSSGVTSAAIDADIPASKERMSLDVEALTRISPPRNADNLDSLKRSADYITGELSKTGCRLGVQRFVHNGKTYENIICSFGPEEGERIVVGAHYDFHGVQPGADDNASGVAGMLELARLIGKGQAPLRYRTDLVAFTLEERSTLREPFRTRHLGSYVYAKSLASRGVRVRSMIALEMIGYFSDQPGSQRYPLAFLKRLYPDKGNFIAVVGKWGQDDLAQRVQKDMAAACTVPVESVAASRMLPGIDFSDHASFWHFRYHAVMITDTVFYRNHNYHRVTDTADTLDYPKMAEVVKGVYWAVIHSKKDS